jgi:hypothetical protein
MLCRCAYNPWPGMILIERHHDGSVTWEPCPDCGGNCLLSCCEGAVGHACDVTNAPAPKREGGDG